MINGVVLILCREHDWRVTEGGGGGGTATRRATLDGLSLMRRCIFLIIMCATVRTKLGPTGLATAASVNNFLGKNKELTRNLFIVTLLSASLACGGPSGVMYNVSLSVFSEV